MSLFETISYSSDKNVVVIDIGAAYTKCGLAGESGPRCIIPSEIKDNKTGKVQKLWDLEKEDKLYEKLKDFLFILYFRHLLLSPKNRRVVVCESMQCQTLFRDTLARVMFKHFEVSSVMFAEGHLMSLLPLGTNTGLVMDVGYTETLVLPVYEGIPVIKAMTCLPLGSKAIHRKIHNLLLETSKANKDAEEDVLLSDLPDCLTESTLEDIKVRCCFVTSMERAQAIEEVVVRGGDESKLHKPPPSVQYPLDGGMILNISGVVREQSCEVLFEQDNEEESLPTLLLDAVLRCPLDMRRELLDSIVLIGMLCGVSCCMSCGVSCHVMCHAVCHVMWCVMSCIVSCDVSVSCAVCCVMWRVVLCVI